MSGRAADLLLARKRRGAAAVLWAERLLPALAPSVCLALGYCAAAMFGLVGLLPPSLALPLLVACALAALGLGITRLRAITPPSRAAQDRRLERGQPHHPLATLADRPALAGSEAIWQAHQARALARVPDLHAGPPRLANGSGAATALLVALVVAGSMSPQAHQRLAQAIWPEMVFPPARAVHIQAWLVAPPRFGLAPEFLPDSSSTAISAPVGTRLSVSVQGGQRQPVLVASGQRQRFRRLGHGQFQADAILTASGAVQVLRHGELVRRWTIDVAPAAPPRIAITGPARTVESALRVPFTASDAYGLTSITAELRLRDRPGAAPLVVAIGMPDRPRRATGGPLPDLTANAWAGLPVQLRYVARDTAGLRGVSGTANAVLPSRPFLNPAARALVGVRRDLAVNPGDTDAAVKALDALSLATMNTLTAGEWLDLRAISALIHEQPNESDQIAARLWSLALQIEDSGVSDAKQRLASAQDALRDALAAPPGADRQQQVAAASQALQRAMAAYLQALERQALRNGTAPPQTGNGRTIDARQLQQMEREMAAAAAAGRTDEAQRLLQQLTSILDHLRMSGQLAQNGSQAKPDPDLQKLTQDQAALRDHSQQRLSDTSDPRTNNLPERDPDEANGAPDPDSQRKADSGAQAGLRQRLGALAQKLGDRNGQVPQGLAKADGAMKDAQAALAKGDDQGAAAAQQRAVQGLEGAGPELAQGQGAGGGSQGAPGPGTDPLGRPLAEGGNAPDDADSTLPGAGDAARGRALRDELRRRAADRTRPPAELDYIQKLLNY